MDFQFRRFIISLQLALLQLRKEQVTPPLLFLGGDAEANASAGVVDSRMNQIQGDIPLIKRIKVPIVGSKPEAKSEP